MTSHFFLCEAEGSHLVYVFRDIIRIKGNDPDLPHFQNVVTGGLLEGYG